MPISDADRKAARLELLREQLDAAQHRADALVTAEHQTTGRIQAGEKIREGVVLSGEALKKLRSNGDLKKQVTTLFEREPTDKELDAVLALALEVSGGVTQLVTEMLRGWQVAMPVVKGQQAEAEHTVSQLEARIAEEQAPQLVPDAAPETPRPPLALVPAEAPEAAAPAIPAPVAAPQPPKTAEPATDGLNMGPVDPPREHVPGCSLDLDHKGDCVVGPPPEGQASPGTP